jgi:hypothetical protein
VLQILFKKGLVTARSFRNMILNFNKNDVNTILLKNLINPKSIGIQKGSAVRQDQASFTEEFVKIIVLFDTENGKNYKNQIANSKKK